MKISKNRLEEMLGAGIEAFSILRPDFGLSIRFAQTTEMKEYLQPLEDDTGVPYRSPALVGLAREFGVVVFDRAKVTNPKIVSTLSKNKKGAIILPVDPFHWDSNTPAQAIIMHNPEHQDRDADTIYASRDDYQEALKKIVIPPDHPHYSEISAALKKMKHPDYMFSLEYSEIEPRRVMMDLYPEFTAQILELLDDKAFRLEWRSDREQIVVQYATPLVLHCREAGNDTKNLIEPVELTT